MLNNTELLLYFRCAQAEYYSPCLNVPEFVHYSITNIVSSRSGAHVTLFMIIHHTHEFFSFGDKKVKYARILFSFFFSCFLFFSHISFTHFCYTHSLINMQWLSAVVLHSIQWLKVHSSAGIWEKKKKRKLWANKLLLGWTCKTLPLKMMTMMMIVY